MQILRIAVFSPLRKYFDYIPPDNFNSKTCVPGIRIKVPFGHKERIGILVEIANETSIPVEKLKPAIEILDDDSLFSENVFKLIHFASQYYHCPMGEVFEAAIPALLRKGKRISEIKIKPKIQLNNEIKFKDEIELKDEINEKITYTMSNKIKNRKFQLNSEQKLNADIILANSTQFSSFVLDGITGSGKTEVYMEVIAKMIEQNRQALILVPEIGLIPQMLDRLEDRFNVPISVLHSGLTEKQRFIAWQNARLGHALIILGTRSAIFTSLKNPGVFIIDEEHDLSFKQQDGFRYSARDLIVMRANMENCPVILGTATPSLETLHNIEKKDFKVLKLNKRTNDQQPPTINIMDIRHKKCDQGLSYPLIKIITQHLENKGQVLLFLNRRGFAPVFMCYDCGEIAHCIHCDAYLTLHFQKRKLKCHHCDYTRAIYIACKKCGSQNLNPVGTGTERLEQAIKTHFPSHSILRIDKDTISKKGAMQLAVEKIHAGDANILLGTQMLTKGHHFPNLTLVAILDIDSALFSVDFRSMERLGQLITQVSGRAGRAHRVGEVVLQTCHPHHPLLQLLLKEGYAKFAETLLMERNTTKLPPYTYTALIRAEAKQENRVFDFLKKIKQCGKTFIKNELTQISTANLKMLGPISAPMEKKQGKFHGQLLLQSGKRSVLHQMLSHLMLSIENKNLAKNLKFSFDIDPLEL